MPKFAELALGAMVTLAGTEATLLSLESATCAPPAGAAALSVTVPVEPLPPTTEFGFALRLLNAGGPVGGFHPSCTTSKSLAVSVENAGLRMSLFQRVSKVPVIYMSEPLSATMRPYFCMARKIFCAFGSEVLRAGSSPFTLVLSRRRAPIGSAPAVLPARCEAGYT